MRPREDATSSFDLFLDTICNTFGGIVFLAILLAIMIQTRAIIASPDRIDESPVAVERLRELISRLEAAEAEFADISAALAALPPSASPSDDGELLTLEKEKQAAMATLAEIMQQQSAATEALAEQFAENESLLRENQSVPQRLTLVAQQVETLSDELSSILATRRTTFRLPVERPSNSMSALLLMRGSSVHVARFPGDAGRGFNDAQVESLPTSAGGAMLRPRPGTGWDPESAEVRTFIERVRAGQYIATIAVWPDSFAEFSALKKELVDAGVPYQLWPQAKGEDLVVSFGAGQSKVQ